MMTGPTIALLLSLQASGGAVLVPKPGAEPPTRPGMVYDAITEHYVPIIGWHPQSSGPQDLPRGTKLEYKRLGQKIGEAPIAH